MRRIQHIVFVAFLMFAMNLTAQSVLLQYHSERGYSSHYDEDESEYGSYHDHGSWIDDEDSNHEC